MASYQRLSHPLLYI